MSQDALKKILIADNDPDVLVALERALQDEGYETAVTVSGSGAVDVLRQGRFDLLVLDDSLSDQHCIQVVTQLPRAGIRPLVVVTYHRLPSPAEQDELRSLGVSTWVAKASPTELAETIQYLLQPVGSRDAVFDT